MGELTNFLKNDTVRIILHYAAETINEFKAQTPATKLALVDKLHGENKIYRQGTYILMGELTNFLGNDTVRIILYNAAETINEFKAQTPANKLALVDKLHGENKIYRQGTTILIDT